MKRILPTFLALLLLAITTIVYAFLMYQVDGYVMRMSVALQGSESLTQRDTTARSIEAFLDDTEVERAALDSYIIKDDDIVSVIELVERVARQENVSLSISSVSVSAVSAWNHHERIDIAFSVDGTFPNITDFVATLEALPFAVRVEGGSLGASSGTSWFGSFSATFVKEKI